MKRLPALTLVAMLSSMLHATDPAGFALWKGDDVAKSSQELPSKMDAQKFAWLSLANYDNHLIGISHREGDGAAPNSTKLKPTSYSFKKVQRLSSSAGP